MATLRRLIDFYRLQASLIWNWRKGRRALLLRLLVAFVVGFISMAITIWLLPGIRSGNFTSIALAVIILSLLNALVRPVILAVLIPVSVIVGGIATILFQVVAFEILAYVLPGITIDNFLSAFVGSWIFAIVMVTLTAVLSIDQDDSYFGTLVRQLSVRRYAAERRSIGGPEIGPPPGLVIVQIDGLAHPILQAQIRAGRLPYLAAWIRSRAMRLDAWEALLPSQTSASQAGILHGNNDGIPAFRWWDKSAGRMFVSNHPEDAAEIVRRVSDGAGLLSNDGASIGNLCSGDAVRSYITMATIREAGQGLGQSRAFLSFFVSPYMYLHSIILTGGEVIKELVQARRQRLSGIEPRMHRGLPYPFARAATNVLLRDLSTSLVIEEMYRGAAVIYVDYTDYDEIAHHSGPERAETLAALEGVDRVLGSLLKAAPDAARAYRFVVLSDHGQSLGATFRQRYGQTLQDVISDLMGGVDSIRVATERVEEWGSVNAFLSEVTRTTGATGAMARAALRGREKDGLIAVGPAGRGRADAGAHVGTSPKGHVGTGATAAVDHRPELVVCASGNLALVYFPRLEGRASIEDIAETYPSLVEALANHPGVGLVMVRSEAHGAIAVGHAGINYLTEGRVEGTDPSEKYGGSAALGLRKVDAMVDCGDLVVISLLDTETDEVAAFEELIGSHGGLGGAQTHPFILHPTDWPIDEPIVGAEEVYAQIRRWLHGIGIELGPAGKPPVHATESPHAAPASIAVGVAPTAAD
ncbi:MAG: alkaline phosphatase family protein [Candidatus Limnocylindrales bacterium]